MASLDAPSTQPGATLVRLLWLSTLVLVLISVAMVTRSALTVFGFMSASSALSNAVSPDAMFARSAPLTLIHIVPGLAFVMLGPLQFVGRLRRSRPRLHRSIGRLVLISGLATGVTALAMTTGPAIGGAVEKAATVLFGVIFVVALVQAFACIRRREVARHREWMIRAFALGLAVATVRPIVGAFFATQRLTHLTPREFFGIAFWIGFTTHLVAAEFWIARTRHRVAVAVAHPPATGPSSRPSPRAKPNPVPWRSSDNP